MACWEQDGFDVRLEWGPQGVVRLAPSSDVVVIVDVLTFSTSVDVAVPVGATVYPYQFQDEQAKAFAREIDAELAVHREDTTGNRPYSLSPASLRSLPRDSRLVLPSPNGATLSVIARDAGAIVLAGCLRNASAVARVAANIGKTIAVIPAGERWPSDDSLRPAVEDLIGAGAIIAALSRPRASPEARAAIATFSSSRAKLGELLHESASGRELCERGYEDDVEIAAQHDVSGSVPTLIDGAFRPFTRERASQVSLLPDAAQTTGRRNQN